MKAVNVSGPVGAAPSRSGNRPRLFSPCEPSDGHFNPVLGYALHPVLFGAMVMYAWFELRQSAGQIGAYYGYYSFGLVAVLIVIEAMHPLRARWKMTKSSFFRRDLPYLLIGAATIGLTQYAAGWVVIQFGLARGVAHAQMPLILGVVLAVLISDLIWYWVHRLMS